MPQECHIHMKQGFILIVIFAEKLPAGQSHLSIASDVTTTVRDASFRNNQSAKA